MESRLDRTCDVIKGAAFKIDFLFRQPGLVKNTNMILRPGNSFNCLIHQDSSSTIH